MSDVTLTAEEFADLERIIADPPSVPEWLRRAVQRHHRGEVAAHHEIEALVGELNVARARSRRFEGWYEQLVDALGLVSTDANGERVVAPIGAVLERARELVEDEADDGPLFEIGEWCITHAVTTRSDDDGTHQLVTYSIVHAPSNRLAVGFLDDIRDARALAARFHEVVAPFRVEGDAIVPAAASEKLRAELDALNDRRHIGGPVVARPCERCDKRDAERSFDLPAGDFRTVKRFALCGVCDDDLGRVLRPWRDRS